MPIRSAILETAMHDRRSDAPETFMFSAYTCDCSSREAKLMLARALVAAFPTPRDFDVVASCP